MKTDCRKLVSITPHNRVNGNLWPPKKQFVHSKVEICRKWMRDTRSAPREDIVLFLYGNLLISLFHYCDHPLTSESLMPNTHPSIQSSIRPFIHPYIHSFIQQHLHYSGLFTEPLINNSSHIGQHQMPIIQLVHQLFHWLSFAVVSPGGSINNPT